jgi:hypothetical protein
MSVSICDTKHICENCVAERPNMRNIVCFVRVRTRSRLLSSVKLLYPRTTINFRFWAMTCRLWRTVTCSCRMNIRLCILPVQSFLIMDVRLKHPFTCTVAGLTRSGKIWFVFRLIKNANRMIDLPPEKIECCYGEFQPSFSEFPDVKFHERSPDVSRLIERFRFLLVLDDLMNEANQNICNLLTNLSHQRNVAIAFITQNLFHSNGYVRTMNLNRHYVVLFKNTRDVNHVASDFGPTDVPRQE